MDVTRRELRPALMSPSIPVAVGRRLGRLEPPFPGAVSPETPGLGERVGACRL